MQRMNNTHHDHDIRVYIVYLTSITRQNLKVYILLFVSPAISPAMLLVFSCLLCSTMVMF